MLSSDPLAGPSLLSPSGPADVELLLEFILTPDFHWMHIHSEVALEQIHGFTSVNVTTSADSAFSTALLCICYGRFIGYLRVL